MSLPPRLRRSGICGAAQQIAPDNWPWMSQSTAAMSRHQSLQNRRPGQDCKRFALAAILLLACEAPEYVTSHDQATSAFGGRSTNESQSTTTWAAAGSRAAVVTATSAANSASISNLGQSGSGNGSAGPLSSYPLVAPGGGSSLLASGGIGATSLLSSPSGGAANRTLTSAIGGIGVTTSTVVTTAVLITAGSSGAGGAAVNRATGGTDPRILFTGGRDGAGGSSTKGGSSPEGTTGPTSGGVLSAAGMTNGATTMNGGRSGSSGSTNAAGGNAGAGGGAAASGAAGAQAASGAANGGAAAGAGGTSANAYCNTFTDWGPFSYNPRVDNAPVPLAATCFRLIDSDTTDKFRGLTISNCDTRSVTVNDALTCTAAKGGCTLAASASGLAAASDGYWYVMLTPGTSSNCTITAWWN